MKINVKRNIRVFAIALFVAFVACIVCGVCVSAYADDVYLPSETLRHQMDDINAQVNQVQESINNKTSEMQDVKNEKAATTEEKDAEQDKYDEICARFDEEKPQIEQAIRNNFSAYCAKELLDDTIGSSFVSNFLFNWDIVCGLADEQDKEALKLIAEYKNEKEYYEYLCNKGIDTESKISQLNSEILDLNQQLLDLQNSQNTKQAELDEMLKIEEKFGKAAESWIFGNGFFAHPCPKGTIVSEFGEARGEGDTSGGVHKGTDFAAPMGTEIYAAADGKVIDATYTDDFNMGRGMMVIIEHADGLVTKYFHCSHVYVPVGMTVTKGQNIALVGSTGDSTGPHCHFQVELNGQAVNCRPYLNL